MEAAAPMKSSARVALSVLLAGFSITAVAVLQIRSSVAREWSQFREQASLWGFEIRGDPQPRVTWNLALSVGNPQIRASIVTGELKASGGQVRAPASWRTLLYRSYATAPLELDASRIELHGGKTPEFVTPAARQSASPKTVCLNEADIIVRDEDANPTLNLNGVSTCLSVRRSAGAGSPLMNIVGDGFLKITRLISNVVWYDDIVARKFLISNGQLTLPEITIRSSDGSLSGSAALNLGSYPPTFKVALAGRDLNIDEYFAASTTVASEGWFRGMWSAIFGATRPTRVGESVAAEGFGKGQLEVKVAGTGFAATGLTGNGSLQIEAGRLHGTLVDQQLLEYLAEPSESLIYERFSIPFVIRNARLEINPFLVKSANFEMCVRGGAELSGHDQFVLRVFERASLDRLRVNLVSTRDLKRLADNRSQIIIPLIITKVRNRGAVGEIDLEMLAAALREPPGLGYAKLLTEAGCWLEDGTR